MKNNEIRKQIQLEKRQLADDKDFINRYRTYVEQSRPSDEEYRKQIMIIKEIEQDIADREKRLENLRAEK